MEETHKTNQEVMQSIYRQWVKVPLFFDEKNVELLEQINSEAGANFTIMEEADPYIYKMYLFEMMMGIIENAFCITDDKESIAKLNPKSYVDVDTAIRKSEIINLPVKDSTISCTLIIIYDPCKDEDALTAKAIEEAIKHMGLSLYRKDTSKVNRDIPTTEVLLKSLFSYANNHIIEKTTGNENATFFKRIKNKFLKKRS